MIGFTRVSAPGIHKVISRIMVSTAVAAASLTIPAASHGQQRSIRDTPTSSEIFDGFAGYEMFSPDRFGTLASPRQTELGFTLVMRMFRNICLALERGSPLNSVMPQGFAAYNSTPYYFGPGEVPRGDTLVLSVTGDIEKDEDGGHPAVWIEPLAGGMTCKLEWRIADQMSAESRQAIAGLLTRWMPWELALVPASRPSVISQQPALSDAIEWDRPCQGRWCPAFAFYNLSQGYVTLGMTLNITDIEGGSP